MRVEKRELPKGWRWVRLKNEITNNISLFKKDVFTEDTFKYIDISSIDNVTKRIIGYQEIPVNDAPSRAKYILEENDIIVATVRPNLNAVAIVDQQYAGCIGSSGFCVVRLRSGHYPKYFFQYLTSPYFVDIVSAMVQGAMYPAINNRDVLNFEIPLPPTLEDQIAIANDLKRKMAEMENMRQAALRQKEAGEAIQDAILKKFFPYNDGDRLPQDWRWVNLGDIAELKNGINFNSSQVGSGTLTLDVFNMYSLDIHPILNNLYKVNTSFNEHYLLKKNDILFVRSSVKKEGVGWPTAFQGYDEPVTFCGFLIRARLLKTDIFAPYLVYYFRKNSVRESFISASGQSTITNINQESLKKVLIPVPSSTDKQISIANDVKKKLLEVDQMRQTIEKQHDAIEAMPGAILREVFNFGKN